MLAFAQNNFALLFFAFDTIKLRTDQKLLSIKVAANCFWDSYLGSLVMDATTSTCPSSQGHSEFECSMRCVNHEIQWIHKCRYQSFHTE